jgi:hypothetical protein
MRGAVRALQRGAGWIPGLVGGGDAGAIDLFSDARLNAYFVRHPNGSGYIPVPGDAVIFSHGQYGHVAIVDSVEAGLVNIVEQNASATGRTTLSISDSKLGNDGVEVPVGVLHPIKDARTPGSSTPAPAPTTSGIVFPVQNTDETPPDGVYFRNSPHTADTSATAGLGVYSGENIKLICYGWGDAVGQYQDVLWYDVANVTRPTADGVANVGWLNAHYIDDGKSSNQVDPGVSPCSGYPATQPGSAPAPTPTPTPTPTPPPTPPPPGETVGGVTHTWTNYSNAGGYQGPSIATSQTVQVACKVTGYAVADGDTWWYRIASSPWNSAYYASADAFYNNGQTSGSLHGTPFVDASVPNC